ncbi:MAG: PAS domain S-box protein [bacterium]
MESGSTTQNDFPNSSAVITDSLHHPSEREIESSLLVSAETLLDSLQETVFVLDNRGIIRFLSGAVRTLSGYTPEMFLNRPFLRFVLLEDRAEVVRRFERLSHGEQVSPAIFRIRIRNGERRWVRASILSIIQEGVFCGLRGVLSDLTEIKRAEEVIILSEERYRRLFHNTSDAIYLWEVNSDGEPGRCIEVNDIALRMTGYTRSEMLKMTPVDLITREMQHLIPDMVKKLMLGERITYETVQRAKSGEIIPVEVNSHLFTIQNRNVIMSVTRDIRERKRAEQEKKELEDRLRESQRLESLGLLAGGIAHDFNNLLVGILGSASLLLDEIPENTPAYELAQTIFRSAKRAADLTNQMLAYAGKGHFQIREIDLAATIEEMVSLLESSLPKKARFILDLQSGLPAVLADVSQINQLVMNLMINAAEALGDEIGTVTLQLRKVEANRGELDKMKFGAKAQPGTFVELVVEDTGIGMDERTLERIFDPFFTTKFTGRGLGLAVVFGIVRSLHAALEVNSSFGRGTRFRALFPALSRQAAPTAEAPAVTTSLPLKAGRILVVDDEEAVRMVAKALLERAGHTVVVAKDGEEATRIITKDKQFTAILLDLMMPRMNGDEVARKLVRLGCKAPIILSSGYNEKEAHNRFDELGFNAFLQKPYTYNELIHIIDAVQRTLG